MGESIHARLPRRGCQSHAGVAHASGWPLHGRVPRRAQWKNFLELCHRPELACQVTVEARDKINADAAIIFSDILVINQALGQGLRFDAGHGPVLEPAIRSPEDFSAWRSPEEALPHLSFVGEALQQTREQLPADCPLIGFCGAPFTLAAYAIEGGGSRQFAFTKQFMYQHPDSWHSLMDLLSDTLIAYLNMQVQHGAQALQIFDSWVGNITRADYVEFVQPSIRKIIAGLPEGIPVILFGTHTDHLLEEFAACEPDVVGVDTTTDLAKAWKRIGGHEKISIKGI